MAEYIERDPLIEICDNQGHADIDDILSVPAADVAPVVRGRWVQCFEDWRKQIEGDKCSACGFEHYGTSIANYHYCPNCGAKMDLEDNQ